MNIRKNRWQKRNVLKLQSNKSEQFRSHHPQVRRLIENFKDQLLKLREGK